MLRNTIAAAIVSSFSLGLTAAHAGAVELVTNGGFETGDFTGWTANATGSALGFNINNGTFVANSGNGPIAPISGSFDAVSNQTGPGLNSLFQLVSLPDSFQTAIFSWADRIENFASVFSDPNQEFRVSLVDAAGSVIETVFSTNPGDTTSQSGPNLRSFDVTMALLPFAGQDIGILFEQQDNLFFFNATIDDVSLALEVSEVPVPGAAILFLTSVLGAGAMRRRKQVAAA